MKNFFEPSVNLSAINFVAENLKNKNIGYTNSVFEFEAQLEDFGLNNVCTTNSNSAGLVVALKALGVGLGDEVLLPRQTFIATGLAILEVGAQPVFCDIDEKTGMLDFDCVKKMYNENVKAVIGVHWGGVGFSFDEINQWCVINNIGFIEDAAHAFGADESPNQKLGISKHPKHFIVFSFQAIKFFTTGDGGCVCCHADVKQKVKDLTWFGIEKTMSGGRRKLSKEVGLNVELQGYKYNMNAISAAIGQANLEGISGRIERRRSLAKLYFEATICSKRVSSAGLSEPQLDLGIFWFFPVLCSQRDRLIDVLAKEDIPSSTIDYRIDVNPIFQNKKSDSGIGQSVFDRTFLALPTSDHIESREIHRICEIISDF